MSEALAGVYSCVCVLATGTFIAGCIWFFPAYHRDQAWVHTHCNVTDVGVVASQCCDSCTTNDDGSQSCSTCEQGDGCPCADSYDCYQCNIGIQYWNEKYSQSMQANVVDGWSKKSSGPQETCDERKNQANMNVDCYYDPKDVILMDNEAVRFEVKPSYASFLLLVISGGIAGGMLVLPFVVAILGSIIYGGYHCGKAVFRHCSCRCPRRRARPPPQTPRAPKTQDSIKAEGLDAEVELSVSDFEESDASVSSRTSGTTETAASGSAGASSV